MGDYPKMTMRSHRRSRSLHGGSILVYICVLAFLASCSGVGRATRRQPRMARFVSQNFFSIDHPSDWVTRDLENGANLFYADELLSVRIRLTEPESGMLQETFLQHSVEVQESLHGAKAVLTGEGTLDERYPWWRYTLDRGDGAAPRFLAMVYNDDLKLLFSLVGSSRLEDAEEFGAIFQKMADSFAFVPVTRIPSRSGEMSPDFSSIPAVWVSFLEGLRMEKYGILTRACAKINGLRLSNKDEIRRVKAQYFPYSAPVYTYVHAIERGDRIARASITVRALPPEGYLKHETRSFIREDGRWKLLRFEMME